LKALHQVFCGQRNAAVIGIENDFAAAIRKLDQEVPRKGNP
jgi:hypothetical protein